MESHKIAELLNKYWDGETTLEEEIFLKGHLHLLPEEEQAYFRGLNNWSQIDMTSNVRLPVTETKVRTLRRNWMKYAAVIAPLVLAIGFWANLNNTPALPADSFDEPQMALHQTEEALFFVMNKLQKGQKPAQAHIKKIETLNIIRSK